MKTTLIAAALLVVASPALAAPVPTGLWRLDGGKAQVRIADCGGTLCATLAALAKPNGKDGQPKRDKRNPDAALRDRPVVGLALVSGMRFQKGEWLGRFYNPDDGRTYFGRIVQKGADKLDMTGCVASLFCKTRALTRIE